MEYPTPYLDIEDFNLDEGARVGVQDASGQIFFGTIKKFRHNKRTGVVEMTVE